MPCPKYSFSLIEKKNACRYKKCYAYLAQTSLLHLRQQPPSQILRTHLVFSTIHQPRPSILYLSSRDQANSKMAPLTEAFPPWKLESKINITADGKARKPAIRNLKDCALKELLQYDCELRGPRGDPKTGVVCKPIVRLFRR